MFSKKTVIVAGMIVLIMINIIALAVTGNRSASSGFETWGIGWIAPFQKAVTASMHFLRGIWVNYFLLVSASKQNTALKRALSLAAEKQNQLVEIEHENNRLRRLLGFRQIIPRNVLAAEVIGEDPSHYFKTIIIDKGRGDGVKKGFPVVVPEGIVGQVMAVSNRHAKVLLMLDPNSAMDAQVQRTRARGILKGDPAGRCLFDYVLRKFDVAIGDVLISSGMDGVYPKGLPVGRVSEVIKGNSGVFQEVRVKPFVDFETIEEVLVIVDPPITDQGEVP